MTLQQRHLDEVVADFTGQALGWYQACARVTDSPIEALMLWALRYVAEKHSERFGMAHGNEVPHAAPTGETFYVIRQARIGAYKADFAILFAGIVASRAVKLVVECDGHDFHEKTKVQAQHDKSRDRAMQDAGWKVYRFTGSEIYRSPLTCAESVMSSLYRADDE